MGLPGVHWPLHSSTIKQDMSPTTRANHLKKLPSGLLKRLTSSYFPNSREADEAAYFLKFAGDPNLTQSIRSEIRAIVRRPATVQSAKGFISAGVGQSLRYTAGKVSKWWKGGSGPVQKSS